VQKGKTDRYTTFQTDIRLMKDFLQRQRRTGGKLNLTFQVSGQAGYLYDSLLNSVDGRSLSLTSFITPERADSMGNGTSICSVNSLGSDCSLPVTANSHSPLRFSHLSCTICGQGYTRWALSGDTSLIQGVVKYRGAGFHYVSALPETTVFSTRNTKRTVLTVHRILNFLNRYCLSYFAVFKWSDYCLTSITVIYCFAVMNNE